MIERNNPYSLANSESLKKVSIKAKKIAFSIGTMAMAFAFTGCGKGVKDNLIQVENDTKIPENAIVYVIDDEEFFANENDLVKLTEDALKKKFGKEASCYDLTLETSLKIEEFDSLDEIIYFKNLESLDLDSSSIEDISIIKTLTNLKELKISNCLDIKDITFLKESNIESLTISNLSSVEDFSFIKEMKNLKKLSISNCENCHITLDMLAGLDLRELSLNFVDIQDLTNISKMKNLERLQINGCNVKNIDQFRELTNLTNISVSDCLISDATSLYELNNLTRIDLRNNSIDNFDITKFPNLKSIYVNSNYALYTDELLEYCEKNDIYIDITKEDIECIKQVRDIISKMNLEGLSTAQKEGVIYSYILENITYDDEALKNEKLAQEYNEKTLYYALQGKGVCANYAALFDAMCDVAGINAYHISGYAKSGLFSGGLHGWNLVEIDGQYMLCDPTWSDTVRDNINYKIFNIFKEKEELSDKYYNVSSEDAEKFIKTHKENAYENKEVPSPRSDEALNLSEEIISITPTKENGKEINGKVLGGIATGSVILVGNVTILQYKKKQRLKREKLERERKAREKRKTYTTGYRKY